MARRLQEPFDEASQIQIRAALERIVLSDQFQNARRVSQFLRYIVDETLQGRGDRLKGFAIAVEVFGRDAAFDTENDTIVRVQAGQLRRRLALFYADEGSGETLHITVPKGSYVPVFEHLDGADGPATMIAQPAALPRGPSIAVLAFDNLSDDPAQSHFADGISEEIINDLTKFRDLSVVARNASFHYKRHPADVRRIGEDLGVDYVLGGSVRRAGDRIRVSAQLSDAATSQALFSEQYDRDLTPQNLLNIQEEIADEVVAKLAAPYGVIARIGSHRASRKQTENVNSYEWVLQYYAFEANPTPEEHARLREGLEQTVADDPDYASGWAALAAIYLDEYRFNFNANVERPALALALSAVEQAAALDPQSSMAQHFLFCARYHAGDMDGFRAAGDRAMSLNPNHPDMLADFGTYRAMSGDWEAGLPLVARALAISVFPPGWYHVAFAMHHLRHGRFEAALADAQKIKAPHLLADPGLRAACHGALGEREECRVCLAQIEDVFPDFGSNALRELSKWHLEPKLLDALVGGLEKAGLKISR